MTNFFSKYRSTFIPLLFAAIGAAILALSLAGCGQQTNEQKIQKQITENVHSLTAEERQLAQTNAKQFFEKQWPARDTSGAISMANGYWSECRPSDSNSNGLVTCFGKVPQIEGGFRDVKRFCGYRKELVGCSDEDTVK